MSPNVVSSRRRLSAAPCRTAHGGSLRLPAPQPAAPQRKVDGGLYLWLGLALLLAYTVQYGLGWRWDWLAALQLREGYKQLSGLLLVLLFAQQWRLSLARVRGGPPAVRALAAHKRWGAIAPLIFYLHAQHWGHAYTLVLGAIAFALIGTGLLQEPVARWKRPRLTGLWLMAHVALASGLLFLLAYHVFVAFWYE